MPIPKNPLVVRAHVAMAIATTVIVDMKIPEEKYKNSMVPRKPLYKGLGINSWATWKAVLLRIRKNLKRFNKNYTFPITDDIAKKTGGISLKKTGDGIAANVRDASKNKRSLAKKAKKS